jgi:hypothetical protein
LRVSLAVALKGHNKLVWSDLEIGETFSLLHWPVRRGAPKKAKAEQGRNREEASFRVPFPQRPVKPASHKTTLVFNLGQR